MTRHPGQHIEQSPNAAATKTASQNAPLPFPKKPQHASKAIETMVPFPRQVLRPHASFFLLLVGIRIEALGIADIADWGDNGASIFAVVDVVPSDAVEEGVGFDAGGAARDVA